MTAPFDASRELLRLINGFQISQAIHVAACLHIADHLVDGARSINDLAAISNSRPAPLYRLLRMLAATGVLQEDGDRRFQLTAIGQCLRSDAKGSRAAWAALIGRPYVWQAWGHLLHSTRSGETAFEALNARDVWAYRADHPEESAIFERAVSGQTRAVTESVLAAYDFTRFKSVVDVGGGNGAFLGGLLEQNPGVTGVLFDQPDVVSRAKDVLVNVGVADRCEVRGGTFFDRVPQGGDAYVLKTVLHDWDDESAIAILRACRQAMKPTARMLVIERIIGPPNTDLDAKLLDLNMLVMNGGLERTQEQFATLFDAGGFRLANTTTTASPVSVLEGEPA
jgi:hypothetical protein